MNHLPDTQGLATTYQYQIVRPRVYATTLAGSTVRTEWPHDAREYAYRIEGGGHRQRGLCDGARCVSDWPAHGKPSDRIACP